MKLTDADREHLEELARLIERWKTARRKAEVFTGEEAERFGILYRHASTLLSMAGTREADPDLRAYLHQLVGQAHSCLYAYKSLDPLNLTRFFLYTFPATFRRHLPSIAAAGCLLFGVGIIVAFLVWSDPDLAYELFDADIVAQTVQQFRSTEGEFRGNFTFRLSDSPLISEWIILNNLKVGLTLFALGALAGVFTVVGLIFNGIMLGVYFGLALNFGYASDTFFLLATHGTLELAMIVLCGGAGFVLGSALLFPGEFTRKEAFRKRGLESVFLMLGTVPFIIFAGLIEGFITPHAPREIRGGVALLCALFLFLYLGWCGQRSCPSPQKCNLPD